MSGLVSYVVWPAEAFFELDALFSPLVFGLPVAVSAEAFFDSACCITFSFILLFGIDYKSVITKLIKLNTDIPWN